MSTTAVKRISKPITSSIKTNHAGRLIVEENILPKAGSGACTHCSCQYFVKDKQLHKPHPVTGNQPNPCGNCGHDFRVHS